MKRIKALIDSVPAPARAALKVVFSVLAGFAVAVMFDYLLFRLGLPSKPFIYVSF